MITEFEYPRLTKRLMIKSQPENIIRLAKYLKFKNADRVPVKRLIHLIDWFLKKREGKSIDLNSLCRRQCISSRHLP